MLLHQLPPEVLLEIARQLPDRGKCDNNNDDDDDDDEDFCDDFHDDYNFYDYVDSDDDDFDEYYTQISINRYLKNLQSLRQVNRVLYAYINPIFWQKLFLLRKDSSERVLERSINENDIALLKVFIDAGADISETSFFDAKSPLELASSLDNVPIARLLLERGAKINCGPLHVAKSAEMVHLLMDFHADPELVSYFERPLYCYVDRADPKAPIAVMRAILERGADVNSTTRRYQWTPLHGAAQRHDVDAVKLLLEFGADVTLKDKELNTPLHFAAKEEGAEVVRLLVECWPEGVREKNSNLDTPLHRAAGMGLRSRALNAAFRLLNNNGRAKVVRFLMECWPEGVREKNKDLDTPLHLAAEAGDAESVKLLMESWPEGIREKNSNLDTPLHFAAESRKIEVVSVLMERWPEGIREKNKDLDTPLHLAAEVGNAQAVELMLNSWPEGVRERNDNLDTPLHLAVGRRAKPREGRYERQSDAEMAETVKLLLERWPECVKEKNKSQETPLDRAAAAGNNKMVNLLAKYWPEGRKENKKKKKRRSRKKGSH
jgi:ankyrin repeat protein